MTIDTIGLDLDKRESQICIITTDGELLERRIATTRARFTDVLGNRPRARILLDASTESEWVARHLESLGHEVIVADPNYASMYATRSRRVKTDKRDARTLCEACRLGAYRAVHRVSDAQRHVRSELSVREALVRTRTRYVALIKAAVGPVTAAAVVATLDQVTRFPSADQVTAYLGLVPSEYSSGERQHRGRITTTGNSRMRWLLVEAGWRILRSTHPAVRDLRAWGEGIAERRGKRVAVVALARKLAGILYAMWRDTTPYRAPRHGATEVIAA